MPPKTALRALKRKVSDALYAQMIADHRRTAHSEADRDPGGHMGNDSASSAAGSHPDTPALRTSHSRVATNSRTRSRNRDRCFASASRWATTDAPARSAPVRSRQPNRRNLPAAPLDDNKEVSICVVSRRGGRRADESVRCGRSSVADYAVTDGGGNTAKGNDYGSGAIPEQCDAVTCS
jgi:hypothetical protein